MISIIACVARRSVIAIHSFCLYNKAIRFLYKVFLQSGCEERLFLIHNYINCKCECWLCAYAVFESRAPTSISRFGQDSNDEDILESKMRSVRNPIPTLLKFSIPGVSYEHMNI